MTTQPRSSAQLAALASPNVALAALGLPIVIYLPTFYSKSQGVALAAVGAAFMGVRLIDVLFDPFIGGIMDRTRTRWGRFRPWLVAGAPMIILAILMLSNPSDGAGGAYLWVWLLVLYAGWSICGLAHSAWASVVSRDYHQRSRIYGWWQIASVVGVAVILVLQPVIEMLFRGDARVTMAAIGWTIALLLPLTIAIAITAVDEPRVTAAPDRAGLREYLALLKRKSVRRLLFCDLLVHLAPGVSGSLFLFYFERAKGIPNAQASLLLLLTFGAALFSAPVWTAVAGRIGKHLALVAAGLLYAVAHLSLILVPPASLPGAVPSLLVASLASAAGPFLLRAMMADVGDEERLETGCDRAGLLYAILTGTAKAATALSVGVTFVGLQLLGFDATNPRGSAGVLGLEILYLGLPAMAGIVTAWVMWDYPLSATRHAEILALLEERLARDVA